MKRTIFIILSIFNLLTISAGDHYFKHLGVSDGLSQISIPSIYQDELGAVWLGTTEGLNRYNGKEVRVFRPSQSHEGLIGNEIDELCGNKKGQMYILSGNGLVKLDIYKEHFTCLRQEDVYAIFCESDTLWVSCKDGIYYYTEESQKLTLYTKIQNGWQGLALHVSNDIIWVVTWKHLIAISRKNNNKQEIWATFDKGRCISKDSLGNLWVGTWSGLYCVSANKTTTYYTANGSKDGLSDNQVRCIQEDDYGRLWIGTYQGLDSYDPKTNTWNHYTQYGNSSNTLSHNSILSLHKDMQGNIWVGTYYGGANVFNPNKTNNHFYHAEPLLPNSLSFPCVLSMTEDSKGNLWLCTDGGGLNRYCPETGNFTRYVHQEGDANSIGSNNLKDIVYRKENDRLYVATHLGGLFVLDLKTNKGHTLRNIKGVPTSLPHNIVNDIQVYKNGLALLTQGGPVFMNLENEQFSPLSDNANIQKLVNKEFVYETFLIDSQQRLWLALCKGGVICIDLPTSKVDQYASNTKEPTAIGRFKTVHIFEDSRGDIYFSTIGSGIFKFQDNNKSFKPYNTTNHSLPSNYCYNICESIKDHRLYLLHNQGISLFNAETERVEDTYHLFKQTYSQGSSLYRSKSGTFFIGGTNGLASFFEHLLLKGPLNNYLNFDKLFIFNKEILPNDPSGILSNIMAQTTDIKLDYDQNNITIEFASFNYHYDHNQIFEYQLAGFDKGWTQTSDNSITYTNLPPGDYTLMVRQLKNKKGSHKTIHLNVFIATPLYASVWAYIFYILCLLGIMIAIIHFKTRQATLRSSLAFERKEKERIEELNQIKLRFFTNISHEFRTPLTLILAQIEVLMQMDKLGGIVYNRILRIYKNAWHMRSLISELLDFRKQEQGCLKIKVEEQDLVLFTRQIYQCFTEHAQKKEINYRFDHVGEVISVWFDPLQLQKVIFNLLSNAFKYTPNKGTITIEVRKSNTHAMISVSDTGVGISEENIRQIFECFYQAKSETLGTGIGLALSKSIIDLHHGGIDVKSDHNTGTRFTMTIPLGNRHFSEEEISPKEGGDSVITSENILAFMPFERILEEQGVPLIDREDGEKPILLLVEDNEELLMMLSELFQSTYEVHTARNGREGLKKAQQLHPELIISDVMMPEMSGKEMCYKIKNNVELSHVSVILLTAQTSAEYMLEGFMFGADDYVTKPFNVKVLIARCNNLIRNKRRLIAHYADKSIVETAETNATNERDKELLERCIAVIQKNYDNPSFDVMSLATELCMGRSKLYMQFKQMTGLTPNEFILKVKLDEAMILLKKHPELNISEISFKLGFSSPRYFSKSFKAFFGVTPQNIRSKKTD